VTHPYETTTVNTLTVSCSVSAALLFVNIMIRVPFLFSEWPLCHLDHVINYINIGRFILLFITQGCPWVIKGDKLQKHKILWSLRTCLTFSLVSVSSYLYFHQRPGSKYRGLGGLYVCYLLPAIAMAQ
jgi:hypothetical protein